MRKYYLFICGLMGVMACAQHATQPMRDANGLFNNPTPNLQTVADMASPSELSFTDVRELSEINIENGQGYPWISGDGLRLYYIINLENEGSSVQYSERPDADSNFSQPITVLSDLPITPLSIWISNDELQAYVCNMYGAVYQLHRNSVSEAFGSPVLITVTGATFSFFSGISLTQDQNEMYAYATPSVIRRFVKTAPNTFSFASTIVFPAGTTVNPGQISKDGLHFIASTGPILSWTLKLLTRTTTDETFNGLDGELIGGLDDPNFASHSQASVSDNMEWIVFIRNLDNTWLTNRLYIAHNTNLSVAQNNVKDSQIALYPNPSSGLIHLKLSEATDGTVEIYNSLGQIIQKLPLSDQIDLSRHQAGIYFAKITTPDFTETKKIIRQ